MFERLIRREPPNPRGPLAELLEGYPAYVAPFPGDPASISNTQARANLDALLAQKSTRLGIIGAALGRFGIDLDRALAASDPNPFFDRIDAWALETWPTIGGSKLRQRRENELVSLQRWRQSDRSGPDIFYSLLLDLALALGEVAIRRRPEMYWGLDLTIRPQDDRVEYHVPVLRGVQVPDAADPSLEEAYALEHGLFVSFVNICTSIDPEMCEPTLYLRGMISGYPAVSRRG